MNPHHLNPTPTSLDRVTELRQYWVSKHERSVFYRNLKSNQKSNQKPCVLFLCQFLKNLVQKIVQKDSPKSFLGFLEILVSYKKSVYCHVNRIADTANHLPTIRMRTITARFILGLRGPCENHFTVRCTSSTSFVPSSNQSIVLFSYWEFRE